ncbi:MAG: amidase [Pararhizobium sp.]
MTAPADPFNAFIGHAPVGTASLKRHGPLAGTMLAVKDIFDVAGWPTGCGLPDKLAEAKPAQQTTAAVQALFDAGAAFVGKTQCDELCFSLMGNNAFYPRPVNPRAPERFTGGSSCGSAAAVAGGLADIATASDTGGSVRAPASFCGLIGLRTTGGLIAMDRTMPLAPSLDTFGWFAADADLYARVGAILLPDSPHRFARLFRIDALDALATAPVAYAAMRAAVEAHLGASRPVRLSSLPLAGRYPCFRAIQAYEAWAAHGPWLTAAERRISAPVRSRFEFGRTISAEAYAAESAKRKRFADELDALLGDDGLIVLPTVPGAAPLTTSDEAAQQAYRERALALLCHSGLSGLPQITIPLGSDDGAPFGISLIGPRGSDRALIGLAGDLLAAQHG